MSNVQYPTSKLEIGYCVFKTRLAAYTGRFFYFQEKNPGNLCNIEKDPAIR